MRRASLALASAAIVAFGVQATASGSDGEKDILEFGTMAGVTEPFTGSAHPVRGVSGGGLPWELDRARGELRSDGRLEIRVDGLVLARRAPVPAALLGTNPIDHFRAVVSCLTAGSPDSGERITTDLVPASTDGDAHLHARGPPRVLRRPDRLCDFADGSVVRPTGR